ncbi:hypothetical protein [Lutibacter sp.]|uniref:hypothetical protein n=1 Tax=Lutibacter sp. TaxID=1925666 RepID=UPI0025C158C9|nr:hypothetical protein [Lutibacter sp.]MCF6169326.1 hypothetical protein [Lutibacter sp.]
MATRINNKTVIVESHKLSVFLDYTTKQMRGTLDLNSLVTENSELKKYFKEAEQPLIVNFSGTIPSDDFMSQPHQPLNFDWEMNVTFQDKKFKVILKTTLQHIEEGTLFSCRLNAMGNISTDNIGLNKVIPDINKTIEIQFVQFILRI